MNKQHTISIAEHGRSACEGMGVTEDAFTLLASHAAIAVFRGSRKTRTGECTSTDARY